MKTTYVAPKMIGKNEIKYFLVIHNKNNYKVYNKMCLQIKIMTEIMSK